MALSLVVEPGDPRLPELMSGHEPGEILVALRRGGRLSGHTMPQAWVEAGQDLDARVAACSARASASGLRWVCPGDRGWPTGLDDLDHVGPLHATTGAPLGVWVRGVGSLAELVDRGVAVVGARDCTTYGAECASDLGADLTDAGWTVVSGAAYGIDGCAHRGALAMGKPTVAVLACGADIDYPRSHAALLDAIAEIGLVVSEQPPGQNPIKRRFLSRNRLIAAMARGTVVVEAAVRSGSLNTLHWADQLGRPTMAVPGPVTAKASGGTHSAIREGKAVLVTSGADVLEELGGLGAPTDQPEPDSTEFDQLPPAARVALDGLDTSRTRTIGDLVTDVHLSAREIRSALALLERRGLVTPSGTGWVMVRRADRA